MSVTSQPQNDARAGTIVVLIDESSEMAAPIAGGTKSKAESVATAVNSMLNQLAPGPDVRLMIVGYGGGSEPLPPAELRWGGPLAGRTLVDASELPASPLRVEQRVRRIPGAGGVGVARQETIQFPIWYVPGQSGSGGFGAAVEFVAQCLAESGSDASGKPPLVIHICGKMPTPEELQSPVTQTALDAFCCCHLHLGASERVPVTRYPSSNQHLPQGDIAALFQASSVLPGPMVDALQAAQVAVAPGARGFVHQAQMSDLIRFLMLGKAYATCEPPSFAAIGFTQPAVSHDPTPVAASADYSSSTATNSNVRCNRLALIVMADRSQADPASSVWLRRQEQVNDILAQIANLADDKVDAGLIVYGGGTVETGFDGPLQHKRLVPNGELADGALRSEQVTEKVSNGIGGLVEIKRTRLLFLDREPTGPVQSLDAAIEALTDLIQQARSSREGSCVLPLVIHVTGGAFSVEAVASAASAVREMGDTLVYHTIVPEQPQPTVAYPADPSQITDPTVAALWHMTSLLAGADKIAAKRKTITQSSRGFVVAAKLDLLFDSIETMLQTAELAPEP